MTMLPSTMTHEGKTYALVIEETPIGVTLTYEHTPINEEYFYLSTHSKTFDAAEQKMLSLLTDSVNL